MNSSENKYIYIYEFKRRVFLRCNPLTSRSNLLIVYRIRKYFWLDCLFRSSTMSIRTITTLYDKCREHFSLHYHANNTSHSWKHFQIFIKPNLEQLNHLLSIFISKLIHEPSALRKSCGNIRSWSISSHKSHWRYS